MLEDKIKLSANIAITVFLALCLFSLPAVTACTLRIDPEVIEQCKSTCSKLEGVKKVSAFQCVCNGVNESSPAAQMVIP